MRDATSAATEGLAAHNTGEPLAALRLFTHNVARVLKPSQHGELAHAIHETLHFALDGNPQDYLAPLKSGANGANGCGGCGGGSRRDDEGTSASTSQSAVETGTSVASSSTAAATGRAPHSGDRNGDDDGDDDLLHIQPGFVSTDDDERPYISYAWDKSTHQLTLPHPRTVTNPMLSDPCTSNAENDADLRGQFDVTAKFFFLGSEQQSPQNEGQEAGPCPAEWIDQALQSLTTATGLETVDTMILAFPTLRLDKKGAPTAAGATNRYEAADSIGAVVDVWRRTSPDTRIASMGLSDFSRDSLSATLRRLCPPACPEQQEQYQQEQAAAAAEAIEDSMVKHPTGAEQRLAAGGSLPATSSTSSEGEVPVQIPSSPSKASLGDRLEGEEELRRAYGPGPCRRPRLCTINLREQPCGDEAQTERRARAPSGNASATCCWDRNLADLCKEEKIVLVAHSDQRGAWDEETKKS